MIDIATLKEYINSSLQTMELSDGTDTIHLEKPCAGVTVAQPVAVAAPAVPEGDAPTAAVSQPKDAVAAGKTINAPIVGVFYAAPSPDSVGQRVSKGDTVCIIEAMKCMNEIQAEADGVITAVLANNGELVEYDQPLFGIQ